MVNDRLEAKKSLLSSDRNDLELEEKMLMAKALREVLTKEVGVYDQTKEIERRIDQELNFPKGVIGNLVRLAGAGIITRRYDLPVTRSVNAALAEDWKRIGNDMKVVVRRNSKKYFKDVV